MLAYKAISSETSSSPEPSVNAPVGTSPGDLLVAFLTFYAGESTTGEWLGDWVPLDGSLNGSDALCGGMAAKVADGVSDEAAVSFTPYGYSVLSVVAFSGADSTPFGDYTPSVEATTTTAAAPSLTAPSAGLLVCAAGGLPVDSTTTWTPPGGMTEILDLQEETVFTSMSIAYQAVAAGTTGTKTFTASGDQGTVHSMSAFIPPLPPRGGRAHISPTAVHRASRW
jgi:hypothetical protein